MLSSKSLKSFIFSLFVFFNLILLVIVLRLFIFDLFLVPSCSMTPTLEPGDIILVSKISYGPRVVRFGKLFIKKKLDYTWHKGLGRPQKGDVIVFNWPDYSSLGEIYSGFYGSFVVKRCLKTSGETVLINNSIHFYKDYHFNENLYLFPHNCNLNWNIDKYGPLWVPGKEKTVKLTISIATLYRDILLYEGFKTQFRNDSVFLNDQFTSSYTFKNNYYLMLGDNFYGSIDSRYWGFVPEKSIVGKAVLVLFSLDPDARWYRKFRWGRSLKRIE